MTTTQPAQEIPAEVTSSETDADTSVRQTADKDWVPPYSAQEFGLLLAKESHQDDLFRLIVSASIKSTDATAGGLYLHRPRRSTIERVVSVGSDPALVRVVAKRDAGLAARAWELEEIVTAAVAETSASSNASLPPEARANVALPLQSSGDFIGVLLLCGSPIHPDLPSAAARTLESIAAQAALAIQNIQLITRERQRELHAAALAAAAEMAVQSAELDEALVKILEATRDAVPAADAATVALFDRDYGIRVSADRDVESLPADVIPQYRHLCKLVGTADTWRVIPDTELVPEYSADSAVAYQRECRAMLLAPLLHNDARIGVLLLENGARAEAFEATEAGFAESIARLMVSSVVQQERRQATVKRLLFQKTIAELYSTLGNTGTAGAFSVLVDGLRQLPYCHIVNLLFTGGDSYGAPMRYSYSTLEATPMLPDLFQLMRDPLTSGELEQIPELTPDMGTDLTQRCYAAGFRSLSTTPLILGSRVIGALNVLSQSPAAFDQEDMEFLENAATALARLVQTERFLISQAEGRQSAEALLEAARQVNATLYADVALDRIVEQIREIVPADCCNVMLLSENYAQVVRWRGYEPLGVNIRGVGLKITDHPNLLQMLLDGQPISANDRHADPGLVNWYGSQILNSYVGAPLRAGGSIIGFVNAEGTRANQFPADAHMLLKDLADISAAALQNAGLYRQLHNTAERLEEQVHERTSQLQIQYAQMETVLSATSEGMLIVANDGAILQSNHAAQDWLTHRLDQDDSAHLKQLIRDVAAQPDIRAQQLVTLGERRIELSAIPLFTTDSERKTVIVTLRDTD